MKIVDGDQEMHAVKSEVLIDLNDTRIPQTGD